MDDKQREAVLNVLRNRPMPRTREEARAKLLKSGVWNPDGTLHPDYGGKPYRGEALRSATK